MKAILESIHKVQKDIKNMVKDGTNDFQHYNYLSETQVTTKMKELFDEHDIFFQYSSKITKTIEYGSSKFLTEVEVTYKFHDVETSECLEGTACGQWVDSGDKGVYKAITGAVKYIYMKTFNIPTGDDPENSKDDSKNYWSSKPAQSTHTQNTQQAPAQTKQYETRTGKSEEWECECWADKVKSPKTWKVFCSEKCWLKPKIPPEPKQAEVLWDWDYPF